MLKAGDEIILRDNAINWVWYSKWKICEDFRSKKLRAMKVGEPYRLHKSDTCQGADDHPKEAISGDIDRRPSYDNIRAFGMSVIETWEARCKSLGLYSGSECASILRVVYEDKVIEIPTYER